MPNRPEPTVRDLLLADLDALVAGMHRALDATQAITDQLEPDRVASCRVAIGTARVHVDEIKLRAHAKPLDEPEPQS